MQVFLSNIKNICVSSVLLFQFEPFVTQTARFSNMATLFTAMFAVKWDIFPFL